MIAGRTPDRCLLVVWQLYRSRYGELLVATRDAEERIRFLGYDPANIKLVAFVVAAVMASIGGAMFVPARRHHLAVERGRRPRSCCSPASRSAAGRRCSARRWARSRRLRPVDALGAVPHPVDLLPGSAVHRGDPVPPRRHRLAVVEAEGRAGPQRTASAGGRAEPRRSSPREVSHDRFVPRRGLPGDPRPDRRLRRLQGVQGVDITFHAGSPPLPHRPERCRQDDLVDALTGLVQGTGRPSSASTEPARR
jgi:hypothetical protein